MSTVKREGNPRRSNYVARAVSVDCGDAKLTLEDDVVHLSALGVGDGRNVGFPEHGADSGRNCTQIIFFK